jgi:hypothetical protein
MVARESATPGLGSRSIGQKRNVRYGTNSIRNRRCTSGFDALKPPSL